MAEESNALLEQVLNIKVKEYDQLEDLQVDDGDISLEELAQNSPHGKQVCFDFDNQSSVSEDVKKKTDTVPEMHGKPMKKNGQQKRHGGIYTLLLQSSNNQAHAEPLEVMDSMENQADIVHPQKSTGKGKKVQNNRLSNNNNGDMIRK